MSNLQKLIENGGLVTELEKTYHILDDVIVTVDREKEKLAKIVGVLVDALEKCTQNGHLTMIASEALQQVNQIAGDVSTQIKGHESTFGSFLDDSESASYANKLFKDASGLTAILKDDTGDV